MSPHNAPPELTIGLVGHRRSRLSPRSIATLATRLRALFDDIASAAGRRPVALITGMADGADLIGAAARPESWRLTALLAEPPLALAASMQPEDATELLRLLAGHSTTIDILSCGPDDYAAQAAALLARAELLVAVWDGKPGRGPGGTADSIDRARATGIPVLVLPAETGAPRWVGNRTPASTMEIARALGFLAL